MGGLNRQKYSPETSTQLSAMASGATRIPALRAGRIRGYSNSENKFWLLRQALFDMCVKKYTFLL